MHGDRASLAGREAAHQVGCAVFVKIAGGQSQGLSLTHSRDAAAECMAIAKIQERCATLRRVDGCHA